MATKTSERVKYILCEKLNLSQDEVTNESNIMHDLGADSLDMVELVMEAEKEFNIAVPDEDVDKIETVAQFISYIDSKISNATQGNSGYSPSDNSGR